MVRYFLLSLLFCTYIFASLAEMVCNSSSIECTDTRSGYGTDYFCSSSANLFCYILNDNTQLIKSQLKNCSLSSNSFTQICLFKNITGNVIIDLDLPENIVKMSFINTLDGSAFGITTSVGNSFLTSLLFRGDVNIENETIFIFFVNLRLLYVQGDMFSNEIPSFTNLHFLTHLHSGFQVSGTTKLDSSMVGGLENLVNLGIWSSNFHEIKLDAFQNLINLRDLAITYNPALTQIQNGAFDSLTKLTRLNLGSTSIRPVGNSLLKPLTQLEDLSLYNSPSFPLEGLIYLRGLKRLSLGYGSHSTLDSFLFQQLNSLTYLSLFSNPIVCNCNLEWIPKLEQQGVTIVGTCSFPISAQGTSITNSSLYTNCPQTESYKCFDRSITCPDNEFCYNTGEDYNCGCAPGYVPSNTSTGGCIDEDECSTPKMCEYSCTNTDGSYYCNCSEGFKISANGYSCEDMNECQAENGDCEAICNNTVGSYSCNCSEGFQISANGSSCEDINECRDADGGCEGGCKNTVGSFKCYCKFGYRIYDETKCSVINEFEILKISIAGVITIGITVAGVIFGTFIVYIIALKMKMTKLKEKESIYEAIHPYGDMQMQINLRNDPNQSKLNNPLIEIHSNPTATQEYFSHEAICISNEKHAKPSDIAATEVRHSNSQIEFFVNGDEEKRCKLYEQVGVEYSSLHVPYEAISNEEQTKRSDIAATEVGPNLRSELFIGGDKVKMGKLYEQVDPEYSSLSVPIPES